MSAPYTRDTCAGCGADKALGAACAVGSCPVVAARRKAGPWRVTTSYRGHKSSTTVCNEADARKLVAILRKQGNRASCAPVGRA